LRPRILEAYDAIAEDQQLTAARAAVAALMSIDDSAAAKAAEALARAGWEIRDSELAVRTPEVREVFFPKGSQWDAFVVLRQVFAEAKTTLTIVDPYCDGTVFQMLAARDLTSLEVKILCAKNAEAVAAEAKKFVAQYPGVTVRLRQAKDFHDRFVAVDNTHCIHVGASIKDAGKTAFMVSRVEDSDNRKALLAAIQGSWTSASPVL
jgi:hypothetical protein